MIEKLEKLGLSQIEAKVYIALLKLGPTFAGPIVAKTKQHRQQIYSALEKLEARHLISVSRKKGKKLFHPIDPEHLYDLVKKQGAIIKEILPALKNKFKAPQEEVIIYHEKDGFRAALQNRVATVKKGEFIQVIGGTGKEFYDITQDFFETYLKDLDNKGSGIEWVIYSSQLKEFNRYFGKYLSQNARARLLPGSQHTPVATIILKDRIQITLFYPTPTVIEIINKSLAEEYRKYFSLLWNQSKQIKKQN